ncbi:hypothetical protein FIBSPDRAFT_867810 [Athelia psychrophila]|uniref:Uncharacterized protein n=1 Tax=Athelia psychrophila TaxID=1759441 RepID=A0A166DRG9_9AGAM|nr:hypothetical protein FIBSPDRAFT_867810 [Fibularhizoctonia sp. CBS 109695]
MSLAPSDHLIYPHVLTTALQRIAIVSIPIPTPYRCVVLRNLRPPQMMPAAHMHPAGSPASPNNRELLAHSRQLFDHIKDDHTRLSISRATQLHTIVRHNHI